MSEWIKHDGKSCPVDLDTKVHVRWGDGTTDEVNGFGEKAEPYSGLEWGGHDPGSNWFWAAEKPSAVEIAEYRVVRA